MEKRNTAKDKIKKNKAYPYKKLSRKKNDISRTNL